MFKNMINVGLKTTYEKEVTPADTYITKSVLIENLLSTPCLLATLIEMSWNMLKPYIPSDHITVVTNLQFSHLEPTTVGEKVTFNMTIESVEKNKIHLSFVGKDNIGEFCNGTLDKAIVNKDKLLETAISRIKL